MDHYVSIVININYYTKVNRDIKAIGNYSLPPSTKVDGLQGLKIDVDVILAISAKYQYNIS